MAEAKTKTAAQKAAPKSSAAPKKSPATKPTTAAKATASKSAEPKKTAAAAKPAAPKKAAAAKKVAAPKKLKPGPEELYRMIQTAAYFIAERNGFAGDSKVYWAQAEAQISRLLD